MLDDFTPLDRRLLDDFQRDLPAIAQPFEWIAARLGVSEGEVIDRLTDLRERGAITRVGATVRPNTAGASTLAALAVPQARLEEVAAQVGAHDEVNHSYLRENDWNLWFVVTASDPAHLQATLDEIGQETGLTVLDLRLKRPFNIDLGFAIGGGGHRPMTRQDIDLGALREDDRPLLHRLSRGLPLCPRPFAQVAKALGREEADVMARTEALTRAGIISRFGVIVRHRRIGWKQNAMVVWDIPQERMEAAGTALAALPGVTLCYERQTVPGLWRHGLFSMIHARSRDEAHEVLERARALPELRGPELRGPELRDADHQVLFSTRCFKQTGAVLTKSREKVS
ncbi:siroheme decarboxylase subunit beta [Rhodalgimonas zhirmunskyi]|uniref:siroheme decarboxylase n=1 Tax=Rhodalgimonas zhirmunskyi TaxID=2964767 RepID=A0AAJ1X6E6_9RHOB|nr:Lrp/AsnC family transcriptional regulator [Rhodoalgimonas zhirmunskyi]MDQ2095134.1 Lrp/AsnC family transcriptional regulator [Rhodoalgimonas zhirmunskyi]